MACLDAGASLQGLDDNIFIGISGRAIVSDAARFPRRIAFELGASRFACVAARCETVWLAG